MHIDNQGGLNQRTLRRQMKIERKGLLPHARELDPAADSVSFFEPVRIQRDQTE